MWSDLLSFILVLGLVQGVRSGSPDVIWIHPSKGESFGPGGNIFCKWTAKKAVVSPSFQLCMIFNESTVQGRGSDIEDTVCGETVWPAVEQSGGGYTMSLVLPDVTIEGEYTLRMKDDFGLFFETSIFSLRSTLTAAVDSATTPDEVQVPLSIPASESSNVTDISPSATVASTADPTTVRFAESSDNASLNPSATASSNTHSSSTTLHPTTSLESDALRTSTSSPVTTTCTSRAVNTSSPSATPQDLATRRMPSTAAFAIPLSAIGAILILAAGLAFQHRRKLGEERTNDAEKLDLSRQSSIHTHESAGQVQYALDVLSRHDIGYGAAPAPVPLFMPVERDSARWDYRWPTKVAFVPASSVAQTSVKSFKAVRAPKSRPLLTRLGLSSRSDAHTPPGTNNAAKWNEDPATYSIIADYVTPSPPLPPSLLTAPERAYVRNEAPGLPTSSRTNGSDHKPLSSNPSS